MTLELEPPRKRTREGTSRVRTGCSTCKARRVKCDEAKPICRRCAVKCRKCEYITACPVPPRNVVTIYLPPTQSQPVFFVNDRGLDFFSRKVAADLDGQCGSKFWSKLVLQLSHSEPSIRHAISAISVIYKDNESSLHHPAGYVNANPEAQEEWNKAVTSLSARIQAYPNSNLVPLVCCLLFTCIGFLRKNVESSMLHVQSGFNILVSLRRDPARAIGSDLKAVEHHIVPMFSRLNVLLTLAGKITPPIYAPTRREACPQEDLNDSRLRLIEISDTCLRFIGEASLKANMFQIDVEDLVEQVKLQTRLDEWRDQLDELLERMQTAGNPAKQDTINLLLVHHKVIYIWIRVCTTAGEMAEDSYHADFEELVHYAKQIANTATLQPLSFDISILGPLYYTALKCRDATIRRRAVDLLQLAPRREGLWNAHYAYATALRVIELEESNLNERGLPDETSRLDGLVLPDDESLIYDPGKMPFEDRRFDHNILPSPASSGVLEAVFRRKPWGLYGEWQEFTEYIKL